MTKIKELIAVKVDGQWLTVYIHGFDKKLKQSYYTVKAEDGSYCDIFEPQVEEKQYEDVYVEDDSIAGLLSKATFSEEHLKLWKLRQGNKS